MCSKVVETGEAKSETEGWIRSGGSQAGQEASGVSLGVHQIAVSNIRKLHACLQATHLLPNCAGMQDSSLKQMIAIAQLCLALR